MPEVSMLSLTLRAASLGGASALLVLDPNGLAMVGLLITSVAGLLAQILKNRDDNLKEERRHRFDVEDRAATAAVRASIDTRLAENATLTRATSVQLAEARDSVIRNVAENTALTREVRQEVAAAYSEANGVNAKIAKIAETALVLDRATERASTGAIRADIADVREHQ